MCKLPSTINFHFTDACNMRCQFCFAGFSDCASERLDLPKQKKLISLLSAYVDQHSRINFVGGEPTIYPYLDELLMVAHNSGLKSSLVTNGYQLIANGLPENFHFLDLIGLSIDSLNSCINQRIGRSISGKSIGEPDWIQLNETLKSVGVPAKINTTISKYNAHEDLSDFIKKMNPIRWKVFQAMRVKGQNERKCKQWMVDRSDFEVFVSRHEAAGVYPIAEPEEVMRGSYAMISPDGRFFDSTTGMHKYSDPILDVGVQEAWEQILFDPSLFTYRTASYAPEVTYA